MKKKITKSITLILLGVFFLFNVCTVKAQENTKLKEIIQNLKSGQLYDEIDLSHLDLTEIPDLSTYSIKKLNISYNKITKFNYELLPSQLEILNISNNEISPEVYIDGVEKCHRFNLKEMNISYNKVLFVSLSCNLTKLEVNNNRLVYLSMNHNNMDYLDMSNNQKLGSVVQFNPAKIKTIKRENIASTDPLEFAFLKQKKYRSSSIVKERQ